jgi:sulfotransferase family protein
MTDIIFHIGLHKTATTSLQNQFFPACPEVNFIRGHGPLATKFLNTVNRTDAAYFNPEKALAELAPRLVEDKVNLVSSESFSWVSWSAATARGIDFRTQILRNLAAAVPDARVVLILRRQDGMVRSLYRQYLQAGGTKPVDRVFGESPDDFRTVVPRNYFRYGPYVKTLKELFPAGVIILPFEQLVSEQEEFLGKLATFIGIESPDITLESSNSSQFGSYGLEFTRWINHFFRTPLNPGGFLPGFPVKRGNKWKRITPSWWLHDNWPIKGGLSDSCSLSRRSKEVFSHVQEDNRALDSEYSLGLSQFGYYSSGVNELS